METKVFNRTSFTYRFLAWPRAYVPYYEIPEDICELRHAVLVKIFLLMVGISILFTISFCVASAGLYGLAQCFELFSVYSAKTVQVALGMLISFIAVMAAGVIGGFVALDTAATWFKTWRRNRRYARDAAGLKPVLDPVTSPIKEMYYSWKNKLCYRVEFE